MSPSESGQKVKIPWMTTRFTNVEVLQRKLLNAVRKFKKIMKR